ncbi:MAG: dicarboxylate/amino acid:cation symporter [Phycisphaeraceae bacterium]|nr:MAG: dicarboxylate/amino acid:cation symporter [Phycisphaeraceae bacterium]
MPSTATRSPIPLHWKVLTALVLGVALGAAINHWWTPQTWASLGVHNPAAFLDFKPADDNNPSFAALAARFLGDLNEFLGKLFLQALRFIAVPVVLFSLILAVASVGNPRQMGRLGLKTIAIFLFTTALAVVVALLVASWVAPGTRVPPDVRASIIAQYGSQSAAGLQSAHALKDSGVWNYLLNILPTNPFNAIANAQILQVVASAILIGLGLSLIPKDKAQPVVRFAEGLVEAVMQLVSLIMVAAPFAVFCLITQFVSTVGLGALTSVLAYALAVIGTLAAILLIEYPILLFLASPRHNRMTPARFFRGMAPAQTLAFSSSSSAATLPVTIQCAQRLGVPRDIAGFVCPLGTSLNMDGTALYQTISVVFLAQLYGVDLSTAQLVTVGVMACAVSVGLPGLPSASVAMMAIVLDSVGVPTEGVAIILAVDRFLDMCRTIVNVSGDAVAAVVVAGTEGRLDPPADPDALNTQPPPSTSQRP